MHLKKGVFITEKKENDRFFSREFFMYASPHERLGHMYAWPVMSFGEMVDQTKRPYALVEIDFRKATDEEIAELVARRLDPLIISSDSHAHHFGYRGAP